MHDVTRGVLEVAELEPRHGVDELVHADRDQRAVHRAEQGRAARSETGHPLAEVRDAVADRLPDESEEDAQHDADEGRDDRHEPAAVEEAEPVDQLRAVEPLPQHGREQTHDDAAEDAGVVVRRLDDLALFYVLLGQREGLEDLAVDEEAHHRGEGRGTVGLLGEADGHTDAEQQRQGTGQRAARVVEHGGDLVPAQAVLAEDVVLAEADHDACGGQDGDREL